MAIFLPERQSSCLRNVARICPKSNASEHKARNVLYAAKAQHQNHRMKLAK
jgi:hypothetical protein